MPAASPPPCLYWAPARGFPWFQQMQGCVEKVSNNEKSFKKIIPNSGRSLPNILPNILQNHFKSGRNLTKIMLNWFPEALGEAFWVTLAPEAPRTEKESQNLVRWLPLGIRRIGSQLYICVFFRTFLEHHLGDLFRTFGCDYAPFELPFFLHFGCPGLQK